MLRSKRYRFVLIFRESFNGYLRCNDVFLGCLVTTCLYFRYTLCLNIGLLPRLLLFVPFLVAGCVPLLVSYRLENVFRFFLSVLPLRFVFYFYWLYNPLHGNADC